MESIDFNSTLSQEMIKKIEKILYEYTSKLTEESSLNAAGRLWNYFERGEKITRIVLKRILEDQGDGKIKQKELPAILDALEDVFYEYGKETGKMCSKQYENAVKQQKSTIEAILEKNEKDQNLLQIHKKSVQLCLEDIQKVPGIFNKDALIVTENCKPQIVQILSYIDRDVLSIKEKQDELNQKIKERVQQLNTEKKKVIRIMKISKGIVAGLAAILLWVGGQKIAEKREAVGEKEKIVFQMDEGAFLTPEVLQQNFVTSMKDQIEDAKNEISNVLSLEKEGEKLGEKEDLLKNKCSKIIDMIFEGIPYSSEAFLGYAESLGFSSEADGVAKKLDKILGKIEGECRVFYTNYLQNYKKNAIQKLRNELAQENLSAEVWEIINEAFEDISEGDDLDFDDFIEDLMDEGVDSRLIGRLCGWMETFTKNQKTLDEAIVFVGKMQDIQQLTRSGEGSGEEITTFQMNEGAFLTSDALQQNFITSMKDKIEDAKNEISNVFSLEKEGEKVGEKEELLKKKCSNMIDMIFEGIPYSPESLVQYAENLGFSATDRIVVIVNNILIMTSQEYRDFYTRYLESYKKNTIQRLRNDLAQENLSADVWKIINEVFDDISEGKNLDYNDFIDDLKEVGVCSSLIGRICGGVETYTKNQKIIDGERMIVQQMPEMPQVTKTGEEEIVTTDKTTEIDKKNGKDNLNPFTQLPNNNPEAESNVSKAEVQFPYIRLPEYKNQDADKYTEQRNNSQNVDSNKENTEEYSYLDLGSLRKEFNKSLEGAIRNKTKIIIDAIKAIANDPNTGRIKCVIANVEINVAKIYNGNNEGIEDYFNCIQSQGLAYDSGGRKTPYSKSIYEMIMNIPAERAKVYNDYLLEREYAEINNVRRYLEDELPEFVSSSNRIKVCKMIDENDLTADKFIDLMEDICSNERKIDGVKSKILCFLTNLQILHDERARNK